MKTLRFVISRSAPVRFLQREANPVSARTARRSPPRQEEFVSQKTPFLRLTPAHFACRAGDVPQKVRHNAPSDPSIPANQRPRPKP